jgi:hypothetical protein
VPNRDVAEDVPGEGFRERLIFINGIAAGVFLHLSIGRIDERYPARQMRDVLPGTVGIASERQKTGVEKRNKSLVGAQIKPKDPAR